MCVCVCPVSVVSSQSVYNMSLWETFFDIFLPFKVPKKKKDFWRRRSRMSTGLTVTEALLTVAEEGRVFFVEDVVLVGFPCSSSWFTSIHTWAAQTKISGCKNIRLG